MRGIKKSARHPRGSQEARIQTGRDAATGRPSASSQAHWLLRPSYLPWCPGVPACHPPTHYLRPQNHSHPPPPPILALQPPSTQVSSSSEEAEPVRPKPQLLQLKERGRRGLCSAMWQQHQGPLSEVRGQPAGVGSFTTVWSTGLPLKRCACLCLPNSGFMKACRHDCGSTGFCLVLETGSPLPQAALEHCSGVSKEEFELLILCLRLLNPGITSVYHHIQCQPES